MIHPLAPHTISGDSGAMAEITSHKELKNWFKKQNRADFAQVIAARAALRVLPYAFGGRIPDDWVAAYSLALFRATAISWAARNFPAHDMGNAARAAATYAPAAAPAAPAADAAAFWNNLSADCDWLAASTDPLTDARRLTREPLWPRGAPARWDADWETGKARLLALDPSYQVWTDWYDRRVRGERAAFDIPGDTNRIEDKKILVALADATDEDFWDGGAPHVNIMLQRWIDEARARVKPEPDEKAETPTSFFISYATKEEAIAQEVAAILSKRGYSSIAQFKDFPQGNFVRAMREGIESTDRFIALQSKAYWESDHCQSEWDAAYARDPGAKQRKIVPFLLEPVPLPPMASEIVYKSLVGLTKAQRKKAIIDWIDYQPPSRSPKELRKTLAAQASPDVRVEDDRIDAGPNTLFDKPLVDMDLAELPANLRALLGVLIASLPANSPSVVRNCLNAYREHLLERGAQPIVGTIDPFASAVQAQIKADSGYWDAGLDSLFADFFKRHKLLITHFPLNPERELLVAETPIDEVKASGSALLAPVEAVGEALEDLKSADLTTEDFDKVEAAHQAFTRDIASLPMPAPSDDVTPKRRYVLGTIGFYERLLAALGAVAGIAATPQGQAAIGAVRAAIETFMGFIL